MRNNTIRRMIMMQRASYSTKVLSTYPNSVIGWPLSDSAMPVAASTKLLSFTGDCMTSGDMEGGKTVWSTQAGTGAIDDETTIKHGGAKSIRLTAGSSANTYLLALINVVPGNTYAFAGWSYGDGTNGGRYLIKNWNTSANIKTVTETGVTGAAWGEFTYSIVVPVTCSLVAIYLYCPAANGGVCYFDDITLTGVSTLNGAYNQATGMTFSEPGMGDGKKSVKASGASSGIGVGSGALNSIWNGDKGTAITWGKIDTAATWADTSTMRYLFHIKAENDFTYYVVFGHGQTTDQLEWRRRAGGASIYSKSYVFTPSGTLDWFCMGFIWDVTSTPKRFAGYLYTKDNNTWQKVFDEAPSAGTGDEAWGTHPTRSDAATLLGGLTAGQLWKGWGAHAYCWPGIVLNDAEMRNVMTP